MNAGTDIKAEHDYWFVGAAYGGTEDQTQRFLEEGIWETGYRDKFVDVIKSIKRGDFIAIKAAYTRKKGLPFENRGEYVSVMAIKAVGTVTENPEDGRSLKVDWTAVDPQREWYFYTERSTLWHVLPGSPMADGLIQFTFNGQPQDYDLFLNHPYWRERYGDSQDAARFGWTRFYEEMADKLLAFRDDRTELVRGIHEIAQGVEGLHNLQDRYSDGTTGPLKDICPFTVMGIFNRGIKETNRKTIALELAKLVGVEQAVPDSFEGVPVLNNQQSWFFRYEKERDPHDIDTLWQAFATAIQFADSDDPEVQQDFITAFDNAIDLPYVAWKLTVGLYWLRPWSFPTLDKHSRQYIQSQLKIAVGKHGPKGRSNASDYLDLMDSLQEVFQDSNSSVHSFPELSSQAVGMPANRNIKLWDAFAFWAEKFFALPDFDARERDYKLGIADRLVIVRQEVIGNETKWLPDLKQAFGAPNNLTYWRTHSRLLNWITEEQSEGREALLALWDSQSEIDGIRTFDERIPSDIKGAQRLSIVAFLLMAVGPEEHPPYLAQSFEKGYDLTGYPRPGSGLDCEEEYQHILEFLDAIRDECSMRHVQMRDRLDAQSILWSITQADPPAEWDSETIKQLMQYRGSDVPPPGELVQNQIYQRLCSSDAEIIFPEWIVTDYLLSLATKPFVLLTGISGTGKTKIAQIVAELLAGDEQVVEAEPVKRDDPASAYHTVGKSTLRYGLVIPRSAEHLFPEAEPGKRREVSILNDGQRYPAVVEQVTFTDVRRAPIMRLMWHKPSKQWIQQAAELGDVLKITPDQISEGVIDIEVIKPVRKIKRTDSRRVAFVPVRADWTDNRDLLGFYNILTEGYEATDLLRVMLRAVDEPDRLHFVILDEMNLAKVEYYFADFLSAMETVESSQGIPLHDQEDDVFIELDGEDHLVPPVLKIPPNVFFTGTVNIDETTHMFSPKVLDRANVIEFHDVDIQRHLGLSPMAGNNLVIRFVEGTEISEMLLVSRNRKLEREILKGPEGESLIQIHQILRAYNRHFGYRVVDECARFLWLLREYVGPQSLKPALDLQVLQKILPKMTGNRSELQDLLERLLCFFNNGEDRTIGFDDLKSVREYRIDGAQMPLSAAKVKRMLERLLAVGFTSFVE